MGLEMSHGCYLGPYSAFNHLRSEIALAAGYDVKAVREVIHDQVVYRGRYELDAESLPPGHELGEWNELPKDPLLILLAHSDSTGFIKAEHCAALADALKPLVAKLVGKVDDRNTDAGAVRSMIDGLREAAGAGEDVEFC